MQKYQLSLMALLLVCQAAQAKPSIDTSSVSKTTIKQELTEQERQHLYYLASHLKTQQDLTALGQQDVFPGAVENIADAYTKLGERLGAIKAKHSNQIAKGDYQDYLDNLAAFLVGFRDGYPHTIDSILLDVNMLRQANKTIHLIQEGEKNDVNKTQCDCE